MHLKTRLGQDVGVREQQEPAVERKTNKHCSQPCWVTDYSKKKKVSLVVAALWTGLKRRAGGCLIIGQVRMSKGKKRLTVTHKACTFHTEEGTLLAWNIFPGCSITLLHANVSAKTSSSSPPGYIFKGIVCTLPQKILFAMTEQCSRTWQCSK